MIDIEIGDTVIVPAIWSFTGEQETVKVVDLGKDIALVEYGDYQEWLPLSVFVYE